MNSETKEIELHSKIKTLEKQRDELLDALAGLKDAVEYTPLGTRGIKAVEQARTVLMQHNSCAHGSAGLYVGTPLVRFERRVSG